MSWKRWGKNNKNPFVINHESPRNYRTKSRRLCQKRKALLDPKFGESEARNRFIDPFFTALGWQLEQTHLPRKLWDVHREYAQRDNSATKKPDYAFRLNGKLKFFVEAKAPWVRIIDNPDKDALFQAKRYAYSTNGKAPIVIITDFQEFRVFNSLQRPIYDNPLQGVIKEFDLKYTSYVDKWNFLYENFSREAVEAGSLETLRGKISKNTKTLDAEFLSEIIEWREVLAKNIAIRNEKLTALEINEAVQRILDRLVFIRNLEDREIIAENSLLNAVTNKEDIYKRLLPLFSELNVNYNGLLFKPHFSEELSVDDKILKDTILAMSYPRSPFQFDVIEPEILGRIYEKFLGSKIRLTDSHRAKGEEKIEVRHAGGVYYTPQFIVDVIVKETVGKRIEGLTPEEIQEIHILDPACGSGSFLLGAYSYLMDYHISFYTQRAANKKYKDDFFLGASGDLKLTLKKKGQILVNNIYGVDIDREATEVSILSLYLKLLEHGIEDDQGWLFLKGKVLPDMTGNIKCGNSLVTRDDLFQNNMFGESTIQQFDWPSEVDGFGKIFNSYGGFDCIIGNPPYIRIQEMQKWAKEEVELYKKIFKSGAKGNFDIYVLFIEKALLLANQQARIGFILPHKFFNASYGGELREILSKEKHVAEVVHFGDLQIFEGATTYTCLLFLSKAAVKEISVSKVASLENWKEHQEAESAKFPAESLTAGEWNFRVGPNAEKFEKLEQMPTKLVDIAEKIFQGLVTSADPVYLLEPVRIESEKLVRVYSNATEKEYVMERAVVRPLCKGSRDIRRYVCAASKYVIFPYDVAASRNSGKTVLILESQFEKAYPKTWSYLKENQATLQNRENGKMKHKGWYGFVYPKSVTLFSNKKLLTPSIAAVASYYLDTDGEFFFVGSGGGGGGGYGITLKPDSIISYEYLLGLLNSSLLDSYLQSYSSPFRGGYFAYNRQYIEKLPIYIPDKTDPEKYALCEKISAMVRQILDLRKNGKVGDAEFLEKKIDAMVEEIYGVRG